MFTQPFGKSSILHTCFIGRPIDIYLFTRSMNPTDDVDKWNKLRDPGNTNSTDYDLLSSETDIFSPQH